MQKSSNGVVKQDPQALKRKLIFFLIGEVIVTYISILFASAYISGATIFTWYNNFNKFVFLQGHFIVGFTKATLPCVILFNIVYVFAFILITFRIEHPYYGREFGNAKWGSAKAFTAKYANHDEKNEVEVNFGNDFEPPEIPVVVNTMNYWVADGVYINLDNRHMSNLNIVIVGPPGTGKTFRVARPILSQLAGAFVVTDPKGELSKQTAQYFDDNGYEPLIFNVESEEGMMNSIHFNPFRYLTNESSILSLSQILFKATTPPGDNNQDPFFEGNAEVVLTSIFYLMFYTYKEADKDWEHFVELLDSTAVKANPKTRAIDISDEKCIYRRFKDANDDWQAGKIDGIKHTDNLPGFIDIEKFYTGAQETTSSIIASLDNHCKYMKLKCVQELLSEDDIQIEEKFGYCRKSKDCETGKRILYIVTSEDKRYFDWITSMVYSLYFDTLYHLTTIDETLHDTLPQHLTFLMDEFNNVTLPDSFVDKLSTMRSRGMSVIAILQNLMQLKNKFPNNDLDKNFMGNFATTMVLGGPDIDSAEILSKMFGKQTINKQTSGNTHGSQPSSSTNEDRIEAPLFSPDAIFQMDKDGPLAMVVKGADPLYEPKVPFEDSPLKPLLTRKKPYRVKRNKPKLGTAIQIDHTKSICEQLEGIQVYYGKEADEYIEQCKKNNGRITILTEKDIDMLSILDRRNKKIMGFDSSTKEFWNQISRTTDEVLRQEKANEIDYEKYSIEQIKLIQRLRNMQFTPKQINAMESLILKDISFDEITKYFGPHLDAEDIKQFADKLTNINKNILQNGGNQNEK